MTVLEFVASIVASLAWPAAIVVAVLILRRHIPDLLRALRRVKISGFELELERTRAEVEGALVAERSPGDGEPWETEDDLTLRAAQQDPIAAVLSSYAALEAELRRRLAQAGVEDTDNMTAVKMVTVGVKEGIFTEAAADAVRGVTVMRNLAAHGRTDRVTVREAVEYAALVEATIFSLRTKPSRPPSS